MEIMRISESPPEQRVNDTFFNAMRPIMFGAQFFGIMPLRGILSENVNKIRFEWCCPQVFHTIIVIFAGIMNICLYLRLSVAGGLDMNVGGNSPISAYVIFSEILHNLWAISAWTDFLMYYSVLTAEFVALFLLAMNWPDLMKQWHATELIFLQEPYKNIGWKLSTKIRLTAILIVLSATS